MTEDDKRETWGGAHQGNGTVEREGPPLPYVTRRPKRRRKGQLNDGEWAPGCGPKRA